VPINEFVNVGKPNLCHSAHPIRLVARPFEHHPRVERSW
jgi:hypothetical protein